MQGPQNSCWSEQWWAPEPGGFHRLGHSPLSSWVIPTWGLPGILCSPTSGEAPPALQVLPHRIHAPTDLVPPAYVPPPTHLAKGSAHDRTSQGRVPLGHRPSHCLESCARGLPAPQRPFTGPLLSHPRRSTLSVHCKPHCESRGTGAVGHSGGAGPVPGLEATAGDPLLASAGGRWSEGQAAPSPPARTHRPGTSRKRGTVWPSRDHRPAPGDLAPTWVTGLRQRPATGSA